jgi:acyl-CoA dehydrogenase
MDERDMLVESVRGVVGRHAALTETEGRLEFDAGLWGELADHGFTLVAVPEAAGGAGADLQDAAALLQAAVESAIAVPLGETLFVASWALVEAGLSVPADRPLTVAPSGGSLRLRRTAAGWRVTGELPRVPWGGIADCVAVADAEREGLHVVLLPAPAAEISPDVNIAGEPRDSLHVDVELDEAAVAPAPDGLDGHALRRRGALARAVAMTGALARCQNLTTTFLPQRSQFGRSLSKFQAVQQLAAELVAEVAAAAAAVDLAIEAELAGPAPHAVAVAKVRTGCAATIVATIAHQLHGAIGITDEYELHHFTRRLWAWRDEFGSETEWSIMLGRAVGAQARDGSLAGVIRLVAA